jgi:hypothetical protein
VEAIAMDPSLFWRHLQIAQSLGFPISPEFLRELKKKSDKNSSESNLLK